MNTSTIESVIEEFEKKFSERIRYIDYCLSEGDDMIDKEELISFIRQALLSREQAIREEIVGKLEGMKQQTDEKNEIPLAEALIQARNTGYNSALSDAIEEIRKIKEQSYGAKIHFSKPEVSHPRGGGGYQRGKK